MNQNKLLLAMFDYDGGDPKRIQHTVKVYEFAKIIGEEEHLEERQQLILETAAIVHDIGIKPSEQKYGSCEGKLQEKEGPPAARQMLSGMGYDEEVIERVCWLVGRHHTYTDVTGTDYRILLEADFLVNLYEDGSDSEAVRTAYEKIFRTRTGRKICRTMFGMEEN